MKDNTVDGSPPHGTRPRDPYVRATHPALTRIEDGLEPEESKLNNTVDGSPLRKTHPHGPAPNSIGAMIGQFKSSVTKRAWKLQGKNQYQIWQRNYYEHIIRNDQEYRRIIEYIEANPINWVEDEYYSN